MAGNPHLADIGKETRFRKGQSGNPKGRSPSKPLTHELRKQLEDMAAGSDYTNAHMIAWKMIQMAQAGRVEAARLIWEYVEGKPTQPITFDLEAEVERVARARGLDRGQLLDAVQRFAERAS